MESSDPHSAEELSERTLVSITSNEKTKRLVGWDLG